jgi:hypothetical protein
LQLVVDVGVDVDWIVYLPACMPQQVPASDNSTIVSGTALFYAGTTAWLKVSSGTERRYGSRTSKHNFLNIHNNRERRWADRQIDKTKNVTP